MPPLFAYGTLMCPDILQEVSGLALHGEPAVLHGFARYRVRGEHYPAIIPEDRGQVEGLLYAPPDTGAWRRLDLFEGAMYVRSSVQVETPNSTLYAAETYVLRPDYQGCLDNADWDFEHFMKTGKAAFADEYKGFTEL